ncbi:ATP-dependent DNA helicase [Paludibacter jiangxiensis]|uniref:Exodeoxyribonuclease-5 n=1 Tax=Paludibacter jiangxiensis TaxID=681398 RepID=A0A161LEM5_9BACT|nr:AAA family ATPase [Paludibacter jiangxiensis]GAT62777.1 exodeoxyribonuclease-5 [Paludibacter jiangxiensis]
MLNRFLIDKIRSHLPFEPTAQQAALIDSLSVFLTSQEREKAFLLKGYAGTGKTSVVSALVKTFDELQQKVMLLAPTGRAAKVLSHYSGHPAFTIHKKIYRQKSAADFIFTLDNNLHKHTLFIVDEASMIANLSGEGSMFGSGQLLDDLVQYVYGSDGCSMILLGDTAQLPPVMQPMSPALELSKLQSFGLNVTDFTLTQVARQAEESGILFNATALRNNLLEGTTHLHPQFEVAPFADIRNLPGDELIDTLQAEYNKTGVEETIVITRSNKRANLYNNGIRARVFQKEEELSGGDLVMVVKNNYFWSKDYPEMEFIANGDVAEVQRILRYKELYGFRFADVLLRFIDYDCEIEARILVEALQAETPASLNEMNKKLYEAVSEDYAHIGNRRERAKAMQKDEFYNALQVKFAYAVTCHKAQGGQWQTVFIDQGNIPEEQLNTDYYRWLYTALTRATEKVYLVSFAKEFFKQ